MRICVTQEDIANGIPLDSGHCPIALAVLRACPALNPDDIAVDQFEVEIGEFGRVPLPDICNDFVSTFDDGRKVVPIEFDLDLPGLEDRE